MSCKLHGSFCKGECKDPNIDNGMMTKVWGPPGWLFLHCVTYGYPYSIDLNNKDHINKVNDFKNFFYYLGKVMPCKYCRESYMDFIKEIPINNYLSNRKNLTKWLYKIHNKVNNKLGVPKCGIPSFKEHNLQYENYRAKCKKTTKEERENNLAKGCVTPANGTPQKCFIKVVKCDKGDITRRGHLSSDQTDSFANSYILIRKLDIIYSIILFAIIIFIIYYYKYYFKR